jgi:hypothetical protein
MPYKPEAYQEFDFETFDAVVTGELVHQALHCEQALISIITNHFCREGVKDDFKRLLLYRDGLSLQHKIEIVRAMLPMLQPAELASELKISLRKVEDLKALRNAFAHGLGSVDANHETLSITVEIVGRSGSEKHITITPTSHCKIMEDAEELSNQLSAIAGKLTRETDQGNDDA